jgi:Asp/Glu/hydantoin racemase
VIAAQKLPIIKAESRWKTVINSVVSSIKTKKNVRNHKARNQYHPLQNNSNEEVNN